MTREEFHRIYSEMPENVRAELIGGVVHTASPLRIWHGTEHVKMGALFWLYRARTPGVEAADNATVMLGDDGEPQPDLYLRIQPEFGGGSQNSSDGYVVGSPELIAEIAHSSRAVDLHAKYEDYRRYGVKEYLVVCLSENELHWFDLPNDRELRPDADGIVRIRTFPGFWIDSQALFADDHVKLLATLEQGLASAEHADFVKKLANQRLRHGK